MSSSTVFECDFCHNVAFYGPAKCITLPEDWICIESNNRSYHACKGCCKAAINALAAISHESEIVYDSHFKMRSKLSEEERKEFKNEALGWAARLNKVN